MGGVCSGGLSGDDLVKPESVGEEIRALNFQKGRELIQHMKMYNIIDSPEQRTVYYDGFLNLEVMMFSFIVIPLPKVNKSGLSVLKLSYRPPHSTVSTGPVGPKTVNSPPGSPKTQILHSGQIVIPFNVETIKTDKLPDQEDESLKIDKSLMVGLTEVLQACIDSQYTLSYIPPDKFSIDLKHYCKRDPSIYCTVPGDLTQPWISQAIGILLERPAMLKPYTAIKENPKTSMMIPICIQGIWRKVQVDNNLAICTQTMKPLFSMTLNNESWPHYLEKAYLKSLRKPRDILSRTHAVPYAIHDLTGAPYQEIYFKAQSMDVATLRIAIEKYRNRRFIICFAIDREFNRDPISQLFSSTCYTLTGKIPILTMDSSIYSMRLSWSPDHEPAPFKENRSFVVGSSGLNDEKIKETGSFFMKIEEIYEYFDVMQVYHFCPSFTQFSIQLEMIPSNCSFIEIDTLKGGNVYFQVSQKEQIKGDVSGNQQRYKLIGIAVFQRNKIAGVRSLNLIFQNAIAERDLWVASYLEPGNYFVMVMSLII